ncbi:MAG: D-aminoacyl-tRNA deacylase [Planctomycetota bacterium]|nr:D-aminoacyl-tRNA deacylase [Planctomycetota bacterium]MDG1983001.1 D-aminoacyl-tRNA deacylase [Planctomycetota bacterium]
MRVVLQRTERAAVRVGGDVVGSVGRGALVLLGVLDGDDEAIAERLAAKIASFRFFADTEGRMNRSAQDLQAAGEEVGLLVVSQFTLAADGRKGRRPSFDQAAAPEVAEPLYQHFCRLLQGAGLTVETGVFGAQMAVELVNDGPATFVLDEPA